MIVVLNGSAEALFSLRQGATHWRLGETAQTYRHVHSGRGRMIRRIGPSEDPKNRLATVIFNHSRTNLAQSVMDNLASNSVTQLLRTETSRV